MNRRIFNVIVPRHESALVDKLQLEQLVIKYISLKYFAFMQIIKQNWTRRHFDRYSKKAG